MAARAGAGVSGSRSHNRTGAGGAGGGGVEVEAGAVAGDGAGAVDCVAPVAADRGGAGGCLHRGSLIFAAPGPPGFADIGGYVAEDLPRNIPVREPWLDHHGQRFRRVATTPVTRGWLMRAPVPRSLRGRRLSGCTLRKCYQLQTVSDRNDFGRLRDSVVARGRLEGRRSRAAIDRFMVARSNLLPLRSTASWWSRPARFATAATDRSHRLQNMNVMGGTGVGGYAYRLPGHELCSDYGSAKP